jgi:hypothetical protein
MISVFASSDVDRGFIDGVMISVLTSSEVDRGCEAPSCQTKDFNIVFVARSLSELRVNQSLVLLNDTGV